jgi:hypothetical protein
VSSNIAGDDHEQQRNRGQSSKFTLRKPTDGNAEQFRSASVTKRGAEDSDHGFDASNQEYGIAKSGTAAMRVFHSGESVSFAYVIFDVRLAAKTGHPQVETQFSLYRDGQRVYSSAITPLNAAQADPTRLVATGTLRLERSLEPGEYMFEAIARDQLAPRKSQMATQWTDLEIVK